jgi:PAS domain S-box-containing protein
MAQPFDQRREPIHSLVVPSSEPYRLAPRLATPEASRQDRRGLRARYLHGPWGRYGAAVLGVLLAVGLRTLLVPVLHAQVPFITFFPAIVFAAWVGGLGPALLALGCSLMAAPFFFDPVGMPVLQEQADRISYVLYGGVGLAIALMGGSMRQAHEWAERQRELATSEKLRQQEEAGRRREVEQERTRLAQQRDRLLEELEARQAFTEAVLRQVPAGILVADARTETFFLSNREAQQLVQDACEPGHPIEDGDGRFELTGLRDDGTRYRFEEWPLMRALRKGEVVKNEEIELVRHDGSQVRISANAAPILDASGAVVAGVAAFHDITERTRAIQAIRESETRFRNLAEAIPQIVWLCQPDGTVTYINRHWYEYTGADAEASLRPDGWRAFVHQDDLGVLQKALDRSRMNGSRFEAECRLRDRHGTYRWFLGRAIPTRNEAGDTVSWVGTAVDIDDRRREEMSARLLAEASTTLAALVDEDSALQKLASLAVPAFADWCVVDMRRGDGTPERLAVAHVDPRKAALARRLHERYSPDPEASCGAERVLRTGEPELVGELGDDMLERLARD